MSNSTTHKISFNITNRILVVSAHEELFDDTIAFLQQQVLARVYDKQLKGVLIDVSGVEIIDSFISRMLVDTAKMVKLLGARTLFTGLKLEIVASLVDLGGDMPQAIRIVLNIDEGLRILNSDVAAPTN